MILEQKFSKNLNARGVARGGCLSFDLTGTLFATYYEYTAEHVVQIFLNSLDFWSSETITSILLLSVILLKPCCHHYNPRYDIPH